MPRLDNLGIDELLHQKVIDPACGSGGFLIAAFDVLVDKAISIYQLQGENRAFYSTPNGSHLVFDKKVQILTSCIYGVDRDLLAVEVARFSLLVKLLSDETGQSIPQAMDLLPSLEHNIVCGDSLVDDRIYNENPNPSLVGIPLNWGDDIFSPYSIVIGNPPYLFTEAMRNLEPEEYEFYRRYYSCSAFRQFDKYYLFIDRALQTLLAEDGLLGMVVSRKFATIESGRKIRGLISRGRHLTRLVDFGSAQMFRGRTTYTCLLFLSKEGAPVPENEDSDVVEYELVTTPKEWLEGVVGTNSNLLNLPRRVISGESAWLLPSTPEELELIVALANNTTPLGQLFDVFNGIQTSANNVYVITNWRDVDDNLIAFQRDGQEWLIERALLKPFYQDSRRSGLLSFHPLPTTALVIFPYYLEYEDLENPRARQLLPGTPQQDRIFRARVVPPDELRNRYPNAYHWLEHNRAVLTDRDIQPSPYPADEWYRYGRDQALTLFENRLKIVVGVNSLGDKYVLDTSNTLLASGGTAGECAIAHFRETGRQSRYDLHFILGLLNHKAIEFFCRKRGSPFRGGWFARGTAVLKDIPVPDIDFEQQNGNNERLKAYNDIVAASKQICDIYYRLELGVSNRERLSLHRRAESTKRRMDVLISGLFGITNIINDIELPS